VTAAERSFADAGEHLLEHAVEEYRLEILARCLGIGSVACCGGDPTGERRGRALAEIDGENMSIRVAVGSKGGVPPIIRAAAACPCEHPDGAVGDVLKSLSEQNVQAMLGQGR